MCLQSATETILEVFWGLFKYLVFKFSGRVHGEQVQTRVQTQKSIQRVEFKRPNVSLMNKA